ncbi:maltose/maltodextrin ABC transporter substrate-binding protein MalE [Neogemmobacter tilapiae]|uniref:Maltodextrin-binding protein n=1 Tax=Neogemmobacter tilapiae TaxID=875041 RepID=A0A918TT15_9RHOB|nr:maltose/maltodextrin ABC transporter substrate-binding protein MalE [Gemmobacter tilapiae]GHC62090.1 maltose ABC transporter substrate-binding protein MalE [Gemmobacter tilapiae]
MTNLKKTALMAALMLGSALPAHAVEEGKLLIWMGPDKDSDSLRAVAKKFSEELGIEVVVEEVDPAVEKFQQAAATGDGPDIMLWAHDRMGEWAAGGLIAPVTPSAEVQAGILPTAWDAVTFGGKTWGYPVAVEAVGLVYNTALVPTPPADFADIAALTVPDGVTRIMWDYNNTYFTMPLLMANGGYAFVKKDGVYDGKDTGVGNAGAIAGATVLKGLIDGGTMPAGVDYGVMDGAMAKGEVAMVINGPWSWAGYEAAGIKIGVAPIPTVNGKTAPPFLGVYSAAVNAASPNADLAVEFIENYMLTDEGLAAWNAKNVLGALADISAAAAQTDPKVQATLANAAVGVPMPSNPEMGAFWSAMQPALTNITTGAQTPEVALTDAAKRILGGG